jgi:ketosteroid isomerase-like protein
MPQAKARAAALLASADDVEAQFYEALASADLERLMALWSEDDEIACVHPGGPRLIGHAAVRAGFEAIFANGAIPVRPQQVQRVESGSSAVHHVLERVDIARAEGPQTAWVIATNVYFKTAQGWRLVLHHGSPGSMRESHELAVETTSSTLH